MHALIFLSLIAAGSKHHSRTPATAATLPASQPAPIIVAPKPKKQWSMAVLDLASHGVSQELTKLVSESVVQEAHKLQGPRVVAMDEIRTMIGFEEQRQLAGCSASECVAEISGALGVDKVLTGSIGQLGKSFLLSLRLVNTHTTQVEQQATARIVGGKGEEFLDAIGPLFEKLFPDVPIKDGEKRGAAPTLVSKASGLSLGGGVAPVYAFTTGAVAVAALGTGIVFGALAKSEESTFKKLSQEATSQTITAKAITSAHDGAQTDAVLADVFLIGGGVVAVTSVILFVFTDFTPLRSAHVGLAPTTGGAVFGWGGAF